jgi:hypothetical protein
MDKTDRELLQAAAKAAGYSVARLSDDDSALCLVGVQQAWNPLTDDGDALRLAVALDIRFWGSGVNGMPTAAGPNNVWCDEDGDKGAAARRAIVRAAAAMVEKT